MSPKNLQFIIVCCLFTLYGSTAQEDHSSSDENFFEKLFEYDSNGDSSGIQNHNNENRKDFINNNNQLNGIEETGHDTPRLPPAVCKWGECYEWDIVSFLALSSQATEADFNELKSFLIEKTFACEFPTNLHYIFTWLSTNMTINYRQCADKSDCIRLLTAELTFHQVVQSHHMSQNLIERMFDANGVHGPYILQNYHLLIDRKPTKSYGSVVIMYTDSHIELSKVQKVVDFAASISRFFKLIEIGTFNETETMELTESELEGSVVLRSATYANLGRLKSEITPCMDPDHAKIYKQLGKGGSGGKNVTSHLALMLSMSGLLLVLLILLALIVHFVYKKRKHNRHLKGEAPVSKIYNDSLTIRNMSDCKAAVKILPEYANETDKAEFQSEIDFMKELGYHRHLNEPVCLIVEFCEYGDLLKLVRTHKHDILEAKTDSFIKLTDLLSFSWQITDGMAYLANKYCVHRDLAARNILMDSTRTAKIGDFGLCRILDKNLYTARGGRLPLKWMSPESLMHYEYTTKSDVWSFGVLMWELYSLGEVPFSWIQPVDLADHLKCGRRLDKPELASDEIYNLMLQCWSERPEVRPGFADLKHSLGDLLSKLPDQYGYLEPVREPLSQKSSGIIEEE